MAPEGLTAHKNIQDDLRLPYPRLAEISFCARGSSLNALTDEALFDACGTRIAFTQRGGGLSEAPYASLNLSRTVGDCESIVEANLELLCESLGVASGAQNLIAPLQVHGTRILEVADVSQTQKLAAQGADGILCVDSEIPVLLCFADCVPVILVAPGGAFCVVHSGWRGAIASIAGKGLRMLAKATCCPEAEINCYIGPHIGACCYEVADELLMQFVAEFGEACDAGERHLDLSHAVHASLVRAGGDPARIVDAHECTSCNTNTYYSYRAEHGTTGRHGAFAIRKEGP